MLNKNHNLNLEKNCCFIAESRTQSEFVYHKSVPIEEDERGWFFMNIEEKEKKERKL